MEGAGARAVVEDGDARARRRQTASASTLLFGNCSFEVASFGLHALAEGAGRVALASRGGIRASGSSALRAMRILKFYSILRPGGSLGVERWPAAEARGAGAVFVGSGGRLVLIAREVLSIAREVL